MNESGNNRSMLVSKNIETYFNDLIVKAPEYKVASTGPSSLTIFYNEYIEHNLLLLVIILGLIIFLVFRYIYKDEHVIHEIVKEERESYQNQDKNQDDSSDTDSTDTIEYIKNQNKRDILKRNQLNKIREQKLKLKRKKLLELEKQSILDIIDELSTLNQQRIQQNKYNAEEDDYYNDAYLDPPEIPDDNTTYDNYSLINNETPPDDVYYNINSNYKNKKTTNFIDGIYIESPYDE